MSPLECQRVGVGPDHLDRRMSSLGSDDEITCTAAYFQHTMIVGQFGLPDEPVMDPPKAGQEGQQVVAGKQRVVAGGWNIVIWMIFGHRIHTESQYCFMIGRSLSKVGLSLAT